MKSKKQNREKGTLIQNLMENKVVKKPQNQTPDLDKAIVTTSPTKSNFQPRYGSNPEIGRQINDSGYIETQTMSIAKYRIQMPQLKRHEGSKKTQTYCCAYGGY